MPKNLTSTEHGKVIALFYIISGAIGLLVTISTITNTNISTLSAVAWLVLLVQISAAIFGGVEILRRRVHGFQILFWVSMSCIPVFGSSLVTYYSALGIGLLPTMSFGSGYSGTSFMFKFGYDSVLAFFSGSGIFTLGANLVAVALTIYLRSLLQGLGVASWPLQNRAI